MAWCARVASKASIVGLVSVFGFVQALIHTGLTSANLTTVSRRYGLTTLEAGVLVAMLEVTTLLFALPASRYGEKDKPKALGLGLLLTGVGSIVFAFPQFVGSQYETDADATEELCMEVLNLSGEAQLCSNFEDECNNDSKDDHALYGILLVGNILIGLGASPLFSLGNSYMDDNVSDTQMPLAIAAFLCATALGPAVGFISSGFFLKIWVDPGNAPEDISPEDPEWVGAWWISYLLFGIIGSVAAAPLFFMPKHLPGSEELRLAKSMSRSSRFAANRGKPVDEIPKADQEDFSPSRVNLVKPQATPETSGSPVSATSDDTVSLVRNRKKGDQSLVPSHAPTSSSPVWTTTTTAIDVSTAPNLAKASHPATVTGDVNGGEQAPSMDDEGPSDSNGSKNGEASHIPEGKADGLPKGSNFLTDFLADMRKMLRNRTFTLQCTAQAFAVLGTAGIAPFLPKVVEEAFSTGASFASFLVGALVVPGAAGGIITGGWLMKRIKATTSQLMAFSAITATIATGVLVLLCLSITICNRPPIAGISTGYFNSTLTCDEELIASCNAVCMCNINKFTPVCGVDGISYFNACWAGCDGESNSDDDGADFVGCRCVPSENDDNLYGTVEDGLCSGLCGGFALFAFLLLATMFMMFINNPALTNSIQRVVELDEGPTALAISTMMYRALGSIPGPIVVGALIDTACIRWEDCGNDSRECLVYGENELRNVLLAVGSITWSLASVFFFLAWRSYVSSASAAEKEAIETELKDMAAQVNPIESPGV